VVASSGLARRNVGFVQGEKPSLSEEGIGPSAIVTRCMAKAGPFLTFPQNSP